MDKRIGLLLGIVILTIAVLTISTEINKSTEKVIIENVPKEVEVTIYNSNLAVVKEYRNKFLTKGLNHVFYEGVASSIDPTSVKLKALNGNIEVLEQNYKYDLISFQKILEKYLGKNVTGYQIYGNNKEVVEGTLLSFSGKQVILRDKDGKINIVSLDNFILPELPEGLIVKPTLEWLINAAETKNYTLELSYLTSGMTWRADYVAVVNKDDTELDLNGWVTITNNAGTTFRNASLKLVAGEVHRVTEGIRYPAPRKMYAMEKEAIGQPQFREEKFFEYHLYTLKRKTTLKNREQKQISLFDAHNIRAEKEYVYDPSWSWYSWYRDQNKVKVMLNFKNSEENNLGIPLPKGIVRVFKRDSEGKLQFIGEDRIDHTPKDETIRIFLGYAFDIRAEKKQKDVEYNKPKGYDTYTWEITIRNHKDEDIMVTVIERVWGDWEIVEENYPHEKESNTKIKWRIPVKANSNATLTYTIRYKRW